MTEFAERLADEGLKLCYHHHMGTIVQSERDIDAFMAHTEAARASAARHRPRALGRRRPGGAGARLSRAHRPRPLQGRARGKMRESNAGDWSFLDSDPRQGRELGVYTVPGDGMIDYVAVFGRAQGLFRLGGARGRAGPEEGAGPALCEKGRRASRARR